MYKSLLKASRTERESSLKWWELHQEIFASLSLLPQSIPKSVHGRDRGKTTVLLVKLEDVFWGWQSSWKVKGEILEGRETHRGKSQNMYVSLPHTHTPNWQIFEQHTCRVDTRGLSVKTAIGRWKNWMRISAMLTVKERRLEFQSSQVNSLLEK